MANAAAIARHGWRGGYVALAIPMVVVAIPIIVLMVLKPTAAGRRGSPCRRGAGARRAGV